MDFNTYENTLDGGNADHEEQKPRPEIFLLKSADRHLM